MSQLSSVFNNKKLYWNILHVDMPQENTDSNYFKMFSKTSKQVMSNIHGVNAWRCDDVMKKQKFWKSKNFFSQFQLSVLVVLLPTMRERVVESTITWEENCTVHVLFSQKQTVVLKNKFPHEDWHFLWSFLLFHSAYHDRCWEMWGELSNSPLICPLWRPPRRPCAVSTHPQLLPWSSSSNCRGMETLQSHKQK